MDGDEIPVHVTTRDVDIKPRRGLVVHRLSTLDERDVRRCRNLPVTSPSRTLLDLAGVLDLHELEAAYAIARRAGLVTPREIAAVIARAPRSKGIGHLRELIQAETGSSCQDRQAPSLTRSIYERRLLKLIQEARLPAPQANAKVLGMEVDLLWAEQKLIVEFDSVAYHLDRTAFERDRERDQKLTAAGYRVIRVTARQLDRSPMAVIAVIAMALAR
jgi:very-short-patch-repair endonuclease